MRTAHIAGCSVGACALRCATLRSAATCSFCFFAFLFLLVSLVSLTFFVHFILLFFTFLPFLFFTFLLFLFLLFSLLCFPLHDSQPYGGFMQIRRRHSLWPFQGYLTLFVRGGRCWFLTLFLLSFFQLPRVQEGPDAEAVAFQLSRCSGCRNMAHLSICFIIRCSLRRALLRFVSFTMVASRRRR